MINFVSDADSGSIHICGSALRYNGTHCSEFVASKGATAADSGRGSAFVAECCSHKVRYVQVRDKLCWKPFGLMLLEHCATKFSYLLHARYFSLSF